MNISHKEEFSSTVKLNMAISIIRELEKEKIKTKTRMDGEVR